MPRTCSVLRCKNRSNRERIKYFYFPGVRDNRGRDVPEGIKRRRLWINALRRTDLTPSKIKNGSICSVHFISGKPSLDSMNPDYVPSVKMGYQNHFPTITECKYESCRNKKLPDLNIISSKHNDKGVLIQEFDLEEYEPVELNVEELVRKKQVEMNLLEEPKEEPVKEEPIELNLVKLEPELVKIEPELVEIEPVQVKIEPGEEFNIEKTVSEPVELNLEELVKIEPELVKIEPTELKLEELIKIEPIELDMEEPVYVSVI